MSIETIDREDGKIPYSRMATDKGLVPVLNSLHLIIYATIYPSLCPLYSFSHLFIHQFMHFNSIYPSIHTSFIHQSIISLQHNFNSLICNVYSEVVKKSQKRDMARMFDRLAVLETRAGKRSNFIWRAYLPLTFFAYGLLLGIALS